MTSIIGSYINSTISRVVKFMIELLFKTSKRAQHTSQRWTRRQLQQATSRWQDRWTSEQGKEGELGGALVKLNPHDPNVAVPPVKELSRPAHLIGRPAVICPINPCLRGSVMLGSTSVLFTRSQVCQQSVLPVFFFFYGGNFEYFYERRSVTLVLRMLNFRMFVHRQEHTVVFFHATKPLCRIP